MSHPKIALLDAVAPLLTLSVPGQDNTPACLDGYDMQTGANGVRYCLVSGVPSISSRRPDDASSFTLTACDGQSAFCSPSHQETVSNPGLFSGYQFTFTGQFSWEDITSHGSSWSISGTTDRALFANGGPCHVVSTSAHGTLPSDFLLLPRSDHDTGVRVRALLA